MSDNQIMMAVLSGVLFAALGIPTICIYFYEIIDSFVNLKNSFIDVIKAPHRAHKKNKQMNCFHLWRKLDGDYSRSETVYRYKCTKCKSDKQLRESEAERFEKDFMSDGSSYYG